MSMGNWHKHGEVGMSVGRLAYLRQVGISKGGLAYAGGWACVSKGRLAYLREVGRSKARLAYSMQGEVGIHRGRLAHLRGRLA